MTLKAQKAQSGTRRPERGPSCYLCGPMTGLPNFNEPSFVNGAALLREAGWFVYNPVENDAEAGIVLEGTEGTEIFDLAEAMKRDLVQVCDVDCVFVLPGYEESKGGSMEIFTAHALGKPVYSILSGREIHDYPRPEEFDANAYMEGTREWAPDQLSIQATSEISEKVEISKMLGFDTGATRNRKEDEIKFEGFLSPLALLMYGEYMHKHRFTADGTTRAADNWQNGIPLDSYMDSMLRHVMDVWLIHRGHRELARESLKEALSGLFFNVQGYAHESVKAGTVQLREES